MSPTLHLCCHPPHAIKIPRPNFPQPTLVQPLGLRPALAIARFDENGGLWRVAVQRIHGHVRAAQTHSRRRRVRTGGGWMTAAR